MKKYRSYILYLLLLISLVGCAEKKLLEKVGLTTLIGYDLGNEDNVKTTAVVRQVNTEFQSQVAIITSENETSQGTRTKINRRSSKKIMAGQLRGVLFGEELARKGVGHYVDTLLKHSEMSGSVLLAVVEGQSKSLLEFEYPDIDDIGDHIYKLLEQNIKGEQMISSTLHEVGHDYYSPGRDIAMPILKKDKELIEISGVALFKNGEMVGKLSAKDSFYVKLIRDNYNTGKLEMMIKGDELPSSLMKNPSDRIDLVFDPIKTKKELKLVNQATPEFDLQINVKARLMEIKPYIDVGKPKNVAKLEKAIGKSLSEELSRVIALSQEADSDVFGFGEYYRSTVRHSDLTQEKWHGLYKEMKVNVHVDFTLLRSGIME
ncbi:Ger(x)C family spore germination protein [Filibacter tadaridae]|uniref:Spore germination protein A3 n=1 Tax=Filibacter tadaridae TaxID=2483811 RepID=A0A3P5XK88_9BACL|nr:Ger(x)C family spore germination protein [Filibacter tadaridae]VDC28086.1 hypothetical protein FILTAD_01707 [Filibacter tadaridae]